MLKRILDFIERTAHFIAPESNGQKRIQPHGLAAVIISVLVVWAAGALVVHVWRTLHMSPQSNPPTKESSPAKQQEPPRQRTSEPLPPPGAEFKHCGDCPTMVQIKPGSFMMGGTEDEDAMPPHEVLLNYAFSVSKYEITIEQWNACVREKSCKSVSDIRISQGTLPVTNVSWEEINAQYLPWLSDKAKRPYRLLTEAEWDDVRNVSHK